MIKVKIIRKPLREELLDEAKEDDAFENYWKDHEREFRTILRWIYGRHLGPGMWQGIVPDMIKKYKDGGKEFAPERQNRIKYLEWATNMHQIGYTFREILDSLQLFHKFSNQLKDKAIKSYSSPNHVISAYKEQVVHKRADKARKQRSQSEERATEEDRTVIYEDDNLFVVRPHTVQASCHYGRKTKWCIAGKTKNPTTGRIDYNTYFDDYTNEEGKVFYFIKDDRRKEDDQYSKVAVQVGLTEDGEGVVIDGYWDRYDNEDLPIENRVPKPIEELDKFFGDEIGPALVAIETHAYDSPPVYGEVHDLMLLDEEVFEGKFNFDHLSISSDVEGDYIDIRPFFSIEKSMDVLYGDKMEVSKVAEIIEQVEEEALEALDEIVRENFDVGAGISDLTIHLHEMTAEIDIEIVYETITAYTAQEGRNEIQDFVNSLTGDALEETLSDVFEAFAQYMGHYVFSKTATIMRDLSDEIDEFEENLQHLQLSYDEADETIMVMQKKSTITPIRIKPFNMEFKGITRAKQRTTASMYTYQTEIRDAVSPLRGAIELAAIKVIKQIYTNAKKQLSFKGFEPKDVTTFPIPDVKAALIYPQPSQIRGALNRKVKDERPVIRASLHFVIDKTISEDNARKIFLFVKQLDNVFEKIYEMAYQEVDIDDINEALEMVYKRLFVEPKEIVNYKKEQGLDPESYTESKKRRKFKVRILK